MAVKTDDNCCVYHICREQDKFDFSKGYIGISNEPSVRWYNHRKYEKAGILKRAYSKYNDIVEYVLVYSSREYCLEIEKKLRPEKWIGWNIEIGGGNPPNHKGKVMSQSHKDAIGKSNSGMKNDKWIGWWIIDGVKYVSMREAAQAYGVTKKTVRDRAHNPKFPDWKFEREER